MPPPLPHWTIGERLGILDFARAAKIAGATVSPSTWDWELGWNVR